MIFGTAEHIFVHKTPKNARFWPENVSGVNAPGHTRGRRGHLLSHPPPSQLMLSAPTSILDPPPLVVQMHSQSGAQPRFQSWGSSFLVWGITALLQNFLEGISSLAQSVTPTKKLRKKVGVRPNFGGSRPRPQWLRPCPWCRHAEGTVAPISSWVCWQRWWTTLSWRPTILVSVRRPSVAFCLRSCREGCRRFAWSSSAASFLPLTPCRTPVS